MREERMICRHAATAFDGRFTLKGAESHYAPDRAFDTEHIRLDLRLDFAARP
jgi:hypothetical protein